tara:strand:- start:235 stop:408 length:174 start_codon:yes stop_codon:yes gene_type:complete
MKIEKAQYHKNDNGDNTSINCTIDEIECSVPLVEDNRHYAEILKQVKEGTLTIKDAD